MCGRYSIAIEKEEIDQAFNAKFDEAFTPRYNAAPSQRLPVILNDRPGKIVFAKWGITPAWMTKRPDGLINVRTETLRDKPTFRSDFTNRRCVVIAEGFYEWKATPTRKTPYRIHLKKKGPLAFAGHMGRDTGKTIRDRNNRSEHPLAAHSSTDAAHLHA